ncbi:MAG TPA: hypothetical protein V6D29_20260 [Leptolyngbyaceae cyanobacterium]
MDPSYEPVSCDFHDQLESYATLRQPCTITYRDDDNHEVNTQALIKDVYTESGAEYVKLEDETVIRLDQLTQVEPANA